MHDNRNEQAEPPPPVIALGAMRINDIIINALVPIALLYARVFRDAAVAKHARALASNLPPLQENSLTETIRRDLLKARMQLRTALHHQGAIQLHRFFCSPLRCDECPIGRQTPLAHRLAVSGKAFQ